MTKFVYTFGNGQAEGDEKMKELLGGKGAGLAEMNQLGIPVPPGFTITTEVCTYYYAHGRKLPAGARGASCAPPSRTSRSSSAAPSSATRPIRCWSACARARASRCPA